MANVVEILPAVYQVHSSVGGRPMYQYLLVGESRAILVDTGTTNTPNEFILPALDHLGVPRANLQFAIVTHSDLDHQGGARQLKEMLPGLILGCGEADRRMVEDPEVVIRDRYDAYRDDHGVTYSAEVFDWMRVIGGGRQPMDVTWTNGEAIRLGDDWVVQVLQMPGHSPGHLVVYDAAHSAVIMGDAVHHVGYRTLTGAMAMPPTYEQVGAYLQTIRQLESLNLSVLAGGHWPIARGEGVGQFLAETRGYVITADRLVRAVIREAREGATLADVIGAISSRLGDWPESGLIDLGPSIAGHVRYLEELGLVTTDRTTHPVRFRWVEGR